MTYGISGPPIEEFREGWAIIPFIRKPHFWKEKTLMRNYVSACGLHHDLSAAHSGINPLHPGDFMVDRCKKCSAKHAEVTA